MDRGIVARIEDWESRPLSEGYGGLRDLAGEEFSGAVSAGGAWLFMLNGRVVGIFDGTMANFEDAEGAVYAAPHPALPLLFAMKERGGETQANYYTDDTPLSEADRTLSDASFTGYIELSENVLSGDYYVVYYGGQSMSAAFVGNAERLLTGDEAFERADDEVGIYEVRAVELDVKEIPDPAGSVDDAGADPTTETEPVTDPGPTADSTQTADPTTESGPATDPGPTADPTQTAELEPTTEPDSGSAADPDPAGADAGGVASSEPTEEATPTEPAGEATSTEPTEEAASTEPAGETVPTEPTEEATPTEPAGETASTEPTEGATPTDPTGETASTEPTDDPGRGPRGASGHAADERAADDPTEPVDRIEASVEPEEATSEVPAEGAPDADPFSEEEAWRETRTIPALDPERTEGDDPRPPAVDSEGQDGATPRAAAETREAPEADAGPQSDERVEEFHALLEEREETIRRLEQHVEELESDRETLLEERERLERRLERAASGDGADDDGGRRLDPETALSRTDLFIRYGSKGKATIEKAHGGEATKEQVNDNLRLEEHTRFDVGGVTVDGRPFETFLADSIEYRFVKWVVEDLVYEIQDTRSRKALRGLYDVLPRIDRAEFRGVVEVRDSDGEREESFDVVLRDRMGQPLLVADINDARDPATGKMMAELVEASTDVGETHETLGAAFLVTASFFEPDALETAADVTGGGLLNRETRKSFVKLSRKSGYHLCLVEARGDDFHVAVPEL